MKYWKVSVSVKAENEKGKIKSFKEEYLVDAQSATEAEARVYEHFEGMSDFEVVSASQSKVKEVIEHGE